METLCGILIPFLGTTAGERRACFCMKKAMNDQVRRAPDGLLRRGCDGGRVDLELADPRHRPVRADGEVGVFTLVPGILGGGSVPAAARSHHPAPATRSVERGPRSSLGRLGDDAAGGDAAQHPGGHGRGRGVCGLPGGQRVDHGGGARWCSRWALRFRTSQKGQSFPCRCARRA